MIINQSNEHFIITVDDGVAHLQLSRPEKANSLALAFWKLFPETIDQLSRSGEVRVMVISAQGRVFCGGLDLQIFASSKDVDTANPHEREAMQFSLLQMQEAITVLERARFPVIAAVQGACLGAGFDLITACDFCFASDDAKFRIEETNIGMMADLGILQRLQHLIPGGMARYLALTGDTLSAAQAHDLGLVVKIFSSTETLLDGALTTARRIADRPPVAINGIKRAMLYSRDHGVYESLQQTALLQASIFSRQDILNSIQAKATGTASEFQNLSKVGKAFDVP
ncbi:enoyl-CoA hydratase-related protein [Photorhabdus heterorhabditis]|uniref:Enoyl-CoA hydratase n=1 Tax=Photorhabdus heterorhabditis TaxID=880156 RepID=A0ABR5KFE5_9GAMM|nr:enoyl-CoA hydratase-related protein [Photorhabdus heterorhabditis]KOY63331.1 enoyl-CoA hydratase [Photorhabdus heterorhabditis]MBS9443757.1 enoyl-CoA hydratase [Photorhabdus heterorhabditis]